MISIAFLKSLFMQEKSDVNMKSYHYDTAKYVPICGLHILWMFTI